MFLWDDELPGFGVRCRRSGARVYFLKYRTAGGRQHWLTLGQHGPLTPDAARAKALRKKAAIGLSQLAELYSKAASQRLLAAYYDGHPTIHIPAIIDGLSTRRVITSELSGGARFAELATWPQHERDLAAETIYRFVFRSLYHVRAFNGDPHPGNYLFHRGGRVTFLDFGLVKHFTPAELQPLMDMARTICVEHDPEAFRASLENAGFLRPGAPLSTQAIVDHLAVFYDTIREPGPVTITSDYASSVVRRFFDLRSPVAGYIAVPRSYVILQRINLGLFAVLGELSATANWRAIAEEIWPFTHGPAATPMGQAEAAWRARRPTMAA